MLHLPPSAKLHEPTRPMLSFVFRSYAAVTVLGELAYLVNYVVYIC